MALYLVGTNHFDIKGPERLLKFLSFVRPGHILHEGTEEQARFILEDKQKIDEVQKRHEESERQFKKLAGSLRSISGKEYEETPEDKKANKMIELASALRYETWAPYEHLRLYSGTKIMSLDDPDLIKDAYVDQLEVMKNEGLERFFDENGMNVNFLDALYNAPAETFEEYMRLFESGYDLDGSLYENPSDKEKKAQISLTTLRDQHFEKVIRESVSQNNITNIVAILGCYHFFGPYHNVYERLKELNPIRLKLNEVDNY